MLFGNVTRAKQWLVWNTCRYGHDIIFFTSKILTQWDDESRGVIADRDWFCFAFENFA